MSQLHPVGATRLVPSETHPPSGVGKGAHPKGHFSPLSVVSDKKENETACAQRSPECTKYHTRNSPHSELGIRNEDRSKHAAPAPPPHPSHGSACTPGLGISNSDGDPARGPLLLWDLGLLVAALSGHQ